MKEFKVSIDDAFRNDLSDGSSCAEHEPFALQVIDDSMEPEFPRDCVIIIDPTAKAQNGSFVFAKDNEGVYIFRQLEIEGDTYTLKALKQGVNTIKLPNKQAVEGVITQRTGKRRAQHKWYHQ